MTDRRSPAAHWGLLGLALLGLSLETGCSEFRARRRLGRAPAAAPAPAPGIDSPVTEGEIITAPASGTPTYSSPPLGRTGSSPATPIGEPALDPDPLPTIGSSPTPSSVHSLHSADAVVPASVSRITLQPPIPAETLSVGPASSIRPARSIPSATPATFGAATDSPTVSTTVAEARGALDALSSYQLNLHRQERVAGTLLPAEDLVMSIRRQPQATRLTWVDGPHRGREVLYRADEPGGQMHIHLGDSKIPMPRMSLAPTSPLVMKNSRHPITEAGLDPVVASLQAADRAGSLVDLGMQTPAPLDRPHRGLTRQTPTGETWRVFLDPTNHLPALVECRASNGDVLEFYHFHDIQPNPAELAAADAFDPDARWGAPRGLFGRIATRNDGSAPNVTR